MEENRQKQDSFNQLPQFQQHLQSLNIQGILTLSCLTPKIIYNTTSLLTLSISITPHQKLPNLPVEVDLRGLSHLQVLNTFVSSVNQLQITQSVLFQEEEKHQNKSFVMKESICAPREKHLHGQALQCLGQYFLEGSQVIFQLDDQSKRMQTLQSQTEYKYPVEFILPPNLPVSLQHKLLSTVHVKIKYSFEVKVSFLRGGKIESQLLTIPFDIIQAPKSYPFEELVLTQKYRCYHQGGTIRDEKKKTKIMQLVGCLCPQSFFNYFYPENIHYSANFSTYDLFHVELQVVASKDNNLFLTVRTYKEPEKESLYISRQRKHLKKELQEEVAAPDVSIGSLQETEMRSTQLIIQKVEIKMFGEFSGMDKEVILSKTIPLLRTNYDMHEGEVLVQLKDYLNYPYSCQNQLFSLKYTFGLEVTFGDQEENRVFEYFKVSEVENELWL